MKRFKFVWDIFVTLRSIKLYKIFDITKILYKVATVLVLIQYFSWVE